MRPTVESVKKSLLQQQEEERRVKEALASERDARVAEFLASGRKLSEVVNPLERIERLRDREFVNSRRHVNMTWTREGEVLDADTVLFESRFFRHCASYGIPLYCRYIWGNGLVMWHARFLDRLSTGDWELLAVLGAASVARTTSVTYPGKRLRVRWGGVSAPDQWEVLPPGKASRVVNVVHSAAG